MRYVKRYEKLFTSTKEIIAFLRKGGFKRDSAFDGVFYGSDRKGWLATATLDVTRNYKFRLRITQRVAVTRES